MNNKIYYLETNALYALCNHFSDIVASGINVSTSLFALKEIVDGIEEENFQKRKVLIEKVISNGVKIYPYLPRESIAKAFNLDISQIPLVLEEKGQLIDKVNRIRSADDFQEYYRGIAENTGIDVKEIKKYNDVIEKENKKKINDVIVSDRKRIEQLRKEHRENPTYIEMDVEKIFGMNDESNSDREVNRDIECLLKSILSSLNIEYSESDISDSMANMDKSALIAFQLGYDMYGAAKGLGISKKGADRNDINDLMHLIYIRDKNHVIVSDDNIFSFCTMGDMRMTTGKFLKLISHAD